MNELLAKLTNLSYEFFGVVLPGVITSMFFLLWWTALGPLAPLWTRSAVPELTIATFRRLIESLSVASSVGIAAPALAIWYFLGHILLWIARSGPSDSKASSVSHRRVILSLLFRIPKPPESFNPSLWSLYDKVRGEFSAGGLQLEWRQFYPVVKSFLSQRLTYSLVATYQNKYTFHRSIVTASAVLFWLSLLTLGAAIITSKLNGTEPDWVLILVLLGGATFLVWGFSSSYMYHWEMFGNSIITEAYSLIYGPKNDQSQRQKSSSDRP